MEPEAFLEALSQFPIVRPADFYVAPKAQSIPEASETSTPGGAAKPDTAISTSLSFFANLNRLLEAQYPPAEAQRMRAQFSALHEETMDKLNLDDFEDLAALLEAEEAGDVTREPS